MNITSERKMETVNEKEEQQAIKRGKSKEMLGVKEVDEEQDPRYLFLLLYKRPVGLVCRIGSIIGSIQMTISRDDIFLLYV